MSKSKRLLTLSLLIAVFFQEEKEIDYAIALPAEYHISTWEDLDGRLAFEQSQLVNPLTGVIPRDIYRKERAYSIELERQTAALRTAALSFESEGPFNVGGRTRAVALDIRNEEVILAGGVSGGIWKSTDGGQNWRRVSHPELRNSVSCITQDQRPGREDTWYAGSGELVGNSARSGGAPYRGDGIFKSTDNGESWFALTSTQDDPTVFNSQFQYIWDIEVNEGNLSEDEILAAAFGGILRSTDGGDTWTAVIGDPLFNLNDTIDLNNASLPFYTALEQAPDGQFYTALSTQTSSGDFSPLAGIWRSSDGVEWTKLLDYPQSSPIRRTVIAAGNNKVYFLLDDGVGELIVLENGRFTSLTTNLPDFEGGAFDSQSSYNMVLKVHPDDDNLVFLGGTNLYRSTDGFQSTRGVTWIGGYETDGSANLYPGHHPDQHDILFYPSDSRKLLSANDGGLHVTFNNLANTVAWGSLNNGFITSQFYTIAQDPNGGDALIGGLQDNGTYLTSGVNLNWRSLIGGDGGFSAISKDGRYFAAFQNGQTFQLLVDPVNLSIEAFGRIDPQNLVTDAGSTFLFVNPYVLDPSNQNRIYMSGGSSLYVHDNVAQIPGGSQVPPSIGWKPIGPFFESALVTAIDVSYDGEVVYYGTGSGDLVKVSSANEASQRHAGTLNIDPYFGNVISISVNPANNQHAVVAFSNYEVISIIETRDGGASFQSIAGNLEENPDGSGNGMSIRWVEVIPTQTGECVLAGTSVGLWSTTSVDGVNTTWEKESQDGIGSSVIRMMDYRPTDGSLVVATHGNGIFRTTVSDYQPVDNVPDDVGFELLRAYPNPFHDDVYVEYTLPADGIVRASLLDANGKLLTNLLWGYQYKGSNTLTWDGRRLSRQSRENGVYYLRIEFNGESIGQRMVLKR